ncbi:MAG: decarboxylating 6-phosphogluconate dehydrogenase [Elusimicrobia bacterium]|nr:decarboxylating 6-phosphogluconate dehydrogenase [Candidatus Obscuribacterium magneticum]
MQIGLIGLGRMGMNMARRLLRAKHEVVVFNRTLEKVDLISKEGAVGTRSLEEFVQKLKAPRVAWLMLPAGQTLDDHIEKLGALLEKGDIVIDGGNSYYKDDLRHAEALKKKGIRYLDAGVSGGIWGLKNGYCSMVGGEKKDFDTIEPLLKDLAPKDGYFYCGPTGAGHYVKMVHNGIEYGLMQAYAEGLELLKASPYDLDLKKIADLWNHGSVVRSWLLELAAEALAEDPQLASLSGYVEDSGEGRWTAKEAIDRGVAAPVISMALYQRFLSREKDTFGNKVLAALRNKFGGHEVVKEAEALRQAGAGAGGVEAAHGQKGVKPR